MLLKQNYFLGLLITPLLYSPINALADVGATNYSAVTVTDLHVVTIGGSTYNFYFDPVAPGDKATIPRIQLSPFTIISTPVLLQQVTDVYWTTGNNGLKVPDITPVLIDSGPLGPNTNTFPGLIPVYINFVGILPTPGEVIDLGNGVTFSVTQVPEASTYGMMLAGLGLVGAMVARRREHIQAVALT